MTRFIPSCIQLIALLSLAACAPTEEVATNEDEHPTEAAQAVISALRSFDCVQTNSGRATYWQRVTGELNESSQPLHINVFRNKTAPKLEHSSETSTLVPGYSGGYFERTYGLIAWSIGSEGTNDYYLLLPKDGVSGNSFGAQLHLQFNHGSYGWWQKILSCTVQ